MKKNIYKFCLVSLLFVACFVVGLFVTKTSAGTATPFGGKLSKVIYCDCSDTYWLFYEPLASGPFRGGPLGYSSSDTITYMYNRPTSPGTWHLGLFNPGQQTCWMYAIEGCYILPVIGHETMVGTSKN